MRNKLIARQLATRRPCRLRSPDRVNVNFKKVRVMKKSRILLTALAALLWLAVAPAFTQSIQGLPRASQKQKVTQTLGITEVTLEYHRPLVRGRTIWGGLVPYGRVWRAGANDNTTIHFSDPVKIEGQALAAGTYGLHMLPGEDEWQVIFSNNHTSWGSFSYDQAEDALRVTVTPEKVPFQEALEYRFTDLTPDGGVIVMQWEELGVPFEIEVDTHDLVLAKIRNDLRHLPGFSWQGWNSAANYCARNKINYEEAMEWIERALSMEKNFANLRVKSLLLLRMGKTEESYALAEDSLEYADEVGTNFVGYLFLERGDFDKAIEIFTRNTRDYPESWNVWDSLAEAQAEKGMTAEARANYEKALSMAPEAQHARIKGVLERLGEGELPDGSR